MGLFNMFSGGGMSNISIVLLGVGPYITASIIMQLLTMIVPRLEQMYKEDMIVPRLEQMYKEDGDAGRQKFNMITRVLTVPLAVVQTIAMISLLKSQGVITALSSMHFGVMVITAVAGTIFLMWLGELITEKGLGNGVSIMIFAGIVAGLPTNLLQFKAIFDSTQIFTYIAFIAVIIVTILGVVFVTEGQRVIPISYARRMRGGQHYGGANTHLPLRVNQAGVIPIIFAVSLVLFPRMIGQMLMNVDQPTLVSIGTTLTNLFANQVVYGVVYFTLVVVFTYFYTAVVFDPQKISENLQRQGGYVGGMRPGRETAEYLGKIVNRITLTGSLFLGAIAILPLIVQVFTSSQLLTIGGTSILIVVSVVIEMVKQIDAQLVMRDYDRI
ncbi:MAG: preprotein translocase subunit SecY [Candidatus Moraniibacteriota bacterium]|nr:MAG: preprotein translocase subunit SecY [Candidatus Moranbacteria bacterium]